MIYIHIFNYIFMIVFIYAAQTKLVRSQHVVVACEEGEVP